MDPKRDGSTDILAGRKKKPPIRLVVDDGQELDNSVVMLHPETMELRPLFYGQIVTFEGKRRRSTACRVVPDQHRLCQKGKIKIVRANLKVRLGDIVSVRELENIEKAHRILVLPFHDTLEGISGDLFQLYLQLAKGDHFSVRGGMHPVEFKVVEMDPGDCCFVAPDTEIACDGEPLNREDEERMDEVGYDDVGGMGKQIAQIREIVELPLSTQTSPGTRKTLLARAIAIESEAFFLAINGPQIMSMTAADIKVAEKKAPSIICMDEIDSIAPNRKNTLGEMDRRVVSQLLTLMDGLNAQAQVIVIGATNRPNSLDPALRRFGRFDREVDVGVPDKVGRIEILRVHTKKMKLAEDVDIERIGKETNGYVGADLASLLRDWFSVY